MKGPIDFSLERWRLSGKDVLYIIGIVWIAFGVWSRFLALEAGQLEIRISQIYMELSYMENRQRTESEQRIYELKKELAKELQKKLEDLQ